MATISFIKNTLKLKNKIFLTQFQASHLAVFDDNIYAIYRPKTQITDCLLCSKGINIYEENNCGIISTCHCHCSPAPSR